MSYGAYMQLYERKSVRVKYHQEVRLETVGHLKLVVCTDNISAGGLGINCDQVTAQAIMPSGYQLSPERPLLLLVELDLADAKLQATCSVQNNYRLAQDSFSFNLKFIRFEKDGQQQLENFMKQQNHDA